MFFSIHIQSMVYRVSSDLILCKPMPHISWYDPFLSHVLYVLYRVVVLFHTHTYFREFL